MDMNLLEEVEIDLHVKQLDRFKTFLRVNTQFDGVVMNYFGRKPNKPLIHAYIKIDELNDKRLIPRPNEVAYMNREGVFYKFKTKE